MDKGHRTNYSTESQRTITAPPGRRQAPQMPQSPSAASSLRLVRSSSPGTVIFPVVRDDKEIHIPSAIMPTRSNAVESKIIVAHNSAVNDEDEDNFRYPPLPVERRGMPHHPFSLKDASYMQAYNAAALENDDYTFRLLCRLNPYGDKSPSFHRYEEAPQNVLDLGCGEGQWVLHAASMWNGRSQVTGFDLVDIQSHNVRRLPGSGLVEVPGNVTWVYGNFVKKALPFPDETFDLVRMANLTLCIPRDRWLFVLSEVRRILKADGRLELIDDLLYFPGIPNRDTSSQMKRSSSLKLRNTESGPPLRRIATSTSLRNLSSETPSAHMRSPSRVEDETYERDTKNARSLETVFLNMVESQHNVSTKTQEFLPLVLTQVFGINHITGFQSFELKVRRGHDANTVCGRSAEAKTSGDSWNAILHRRGTGGGTSQGKNRPQYDFDSSGAFNGIDASSSKIERVPVHHSTSSKTQAAHESRPSPSLELVLSSVRASDPPVPLHLSPIELEMHACKNINTLMCCRHWLIEFAEAHKGANGHPLIPEKELDRYMWDYDRFRRNRFNWPADYPDVQMEVDLDDMPSSPKPAIFKKLLSNLATSPNSDRQRTPSKNDIPACPKDGQQKTDVRQICVYHVVKNL